MILLPWPTAGESWVLLIILTAVVALALGILGCYTFMRRRQAATGAADTVATGEPGIDDVGTVLTPNGLPTTAEGASQFFELYKLMVQSSESLVARRQGTNTFFLTANSVLLTVIALFIRTGYAPGTHALAVAIFCLTGLILSISWRTLLSTFRQLNAGKFAVILRMEQQLVAAIYDAEWQALGRGKQPLLYRGFTKSESWVPSLFMVVYGLAGVVALLIFLGRFWKA